jgi:glycerophosphoryl diester phosphodiesterase
LKSPPARRGKRGYLKIAHRGASASEPEDTLRAFKEAVGLGADMIEVDVRLSKDGLPVIIHDASLERTTNGTGYVRDKTLLELKELDAGQGERIPTLQEAIDFARGKCGLYIELKDQAAPGPVVETIRANGFEGEAIICSFDHALLRQVKELAPEIPTSVLVGETSGDFVEIARAAGADYIHFCWEGRSPTPHKLLTPELVAKIHEQGLGIIIWHEERPEEIREILKYPIEGICSDRPDLLSASSSHDGEGANWEG